MSTFTAGDEAPLLRVLARYTELDEDDRAALMQLDTGPLCTANGRADLAREGDHPTHIRLLVSGWACRYKDLADGRRQIVGFFLPGDFCDLNIYFTTRMDHSIGALTDDQKHLLCDPQTSGGLLVAVTPEGEQAFLAVAAELGLDLAPIGLLAERQSHAVEVN